MPLSLKWFMTGLFKLDIRDVHFLRLSSMIFSLSWQNMWVQYLENTRIFFNLKLTQKWINSCWKCPKSTISLPQLRIYLGYLFVTFKYVVICLTILIWIPGEILLSCYLIHCYFSKTCKREKISKLLMFFDISENFANRRFLFPAFLVLPNMFSTISNLPCKAARCIGV